MKTDVYTKAVLTVTALALTVIALRPIFDPGAAYAASPARYLTKRSSEFLMEKDLNGFALKGWRLVTIVREPSGGDGLSLVLERDR